MLLPKRTKYRKSQRGKRKGLAVSGSTVCFGEYGIKALGSAWLKNNQIETARIILSRRLRRGGKLWIRVFPDKSVTKKPAESRIGKGKGEVDSWVAVIRRGRVLFEIGGIPEDYARASFRLVAYKLPFKTMFVKRR
ncbi:MAG: 50S ribosomal protein L16 [Candidatus Omnitrophica bacterium]|nr:50S ribosomal protein L16 [Candidatus Omnitrophota bacterium]MBU0878607.1 50S ribosomal protein L16 [Candidatus Omnitrophota bacterium]MBU0897274.1 50S ribosomal protein L16 [Candidatus Omnitrophota bacterium]MBU1811232.1 50S ribosomal protein L16 [Candidatus Omnitrophota bacterium]